MIINFLNDPSFRVAIYVTAPGPGPGPPGRSTTFAFCGLFLGRREKPQFYTARLGVLVYMSLDSITGRDNKHSESAAAAADCH